MKRKAVSDILFDPSDPESCAALRDRILARSEAMPSGCIEWRGPVLKWRNSRGGYGVMWVMLPSGRKKTTVHRLMLATKTGLLGRFVFALHSCDNRLCVNIHHLRPGSGKENAADRIKSGHQGRGDTHWSRLRPELIRRGENAKQTKVKGELAREVERRHLAGETQSALASTFGVSQSAISRALIRQRARLTSMVSA